jgi:hypothetical protein
MRINNDRDLTLGDLPMQERAVEMSEDRSEKVSDKDKIQILLQEYNTLRSELVSNGSKQFQLVALAGVLVSLILGRPIEKGFMGCDPCWGRCIVLFGCYCDPTYPEACSKGDRA